MTDWTQASDQEINRAVAEAMGWIPVPKDDPRYSIWVERYYKPDGEGASLPDFLHDWRAFGRLLDYLDGDPVTKRPAFGWELHPNAAKVMGDTVGEAICERRPRRALALAFLESQEARE